MQLKGLRVRDQAAKRARSAPGKSTSPKALRQNTVATNSLTPAKPLAMGDLAQSLGYRIRRAQLWVFKDISRRLAPFDISPAQFSVLSVIEANPGVNQLALAQLLSIERAGLGRMMDQLEQRGLVVRAASPLNRRYYVLHLTPDGGALVARLRPIIAEGEKALAKKIGSQAFKELQRTLSIFLDE
ncbi:MarR family winged helix-turn-helix transcriptional regulator [Bradyrhizobium sp. HKCCYLS1011]|uniref:MarR family winged helix-turn-helix transcriptional regulator n=1 Tax=Bradyrhizobium sp. HKCCYLS1011 TaxID=3420733 RepID=UPI003EBA0720